MDWLAQAHQTSKPSVVAIMDPVAVASCLAVLTSPRHPYQDRTPVLIPALHSTHPHSEHRRIQRCCVEFSCSTTTIKGVVSWPKLSRAEFGVGVGHPSDRLLREMHPSPARRSHIIHCPPLCMALSQYWSSLRSWLNENAAFPCSSMCCSQFSWKRSETWTSTSSAGVLPPALVSRKPCCRKYVVSRPSS